MQTTFFVELRFWVENLVARCYKNQVNGKGVKEEMGMTLRNIEMYGYIGSKTKSYQI